MTGPAGDVVAALRTSPLFALLPDRDLAELAAGGRTVEVAAGTVLMAEGDPADAMVVVLDGEVEVSRNGSGPHVLLNVCTRGDLLGELGVLQGLPRSATVRARTAVRVHRIGADALDRLLAHAGPRAVVWEHNTHIGDARATDMAEAGMTNVGQLLRERHGADGVVLVGFGGYRGGVLAGRGWGEQVERMPVPAARPGSLEAVLHERVGRDALLVWPVSGPRPAELQRRLDHRAIGVVYRPERERWGNYVPTVLGERYDAFLYLEETTPLQPLHLERAGEHVPPAAEAV